MATGVLVGLTGIGGGLLLYAALLLLLGRVRPGQVVGTDLAFGAVLASAAALAHVAVGTVDYRLVGLLLAGSVPGVLLGVRLAGIAPPRALRAGLCVCILATGLRLATA